MSSCDWKYLIVEFPEEETTDGIPMALISSRWLINTQSNNLSCFWPSYIKYTTQREKAVLNHQDLKFDKCTKCQIRVKYSTADYSLAQIKLKKIEDAQTSASDASVSHLQLAARHKKPIRSSEFIYSDCQSETRGEQSDSSLDPPTPPRLKEGKKNTFKSQNSPDIFINRKDSSQQKNDNNVCVAKESRKECCKCEDNSDILKSLVREVQNIKLDVKCTLNAVMTMANATRDVELNDVDACKTFDELVSFDKKLSNEEYFSTCVSKLGIVGGKDGPDTTRKILMILIENNLAKNLNWSGRNNKNGLEALQDFIKLIHNAVRRNPLTKTATNSEINKSIMNWLRNAKDRDGGRKQRGPKEDNP